MAGDCTVAGCERKHYSKGLCRAHYMKKSRKEKKDKASTDEPDTVSGSSTAGEPEQTDQYIPPDEVKIGVPGVMPDGYTKPAQQQIGPDGKPLPAKPGGPGSYSFSFGSLQVALAWEQLSRLAPDARPLELTPQQRLELDAAFAAAGITVNNPWVVIIGIIVPPTVLFIIMNYEEIKKNGQKMFEDIARFTAGLKPKKKPEPAGMLGP